jgi:hypothetical protein
MSNKTEERSARGTSISNFKTPRSKRLHTDRKPKEPALLQQGRGPLREAIAARKKFLRFFPKGFQDEKYKAWERDYKWNAHCEWVEKLGPSEFRALLKKGQHTEAAAQAVRIESRTNLLFSFEKMALRDAVKSTEGARMFAEGLYNFLHGAGSPGKRFEQWCEVVAALPRKQTRVLTWPVVTVFGFLAQPEQHMFVKPNVTKLAALECGFDFRYASRPSWETYEHILEFAAKVRRDIRDLRPRDFIDIQSFLWVQGSSEYD